jgi:hypothetical protein
MQAAQQFSRYFKTAESRTAQDPGARMINIQAGRFPIRLTARKGRRHHTGDAITPHQRSFIKTRHLDAFGKQPQLSIR